MEYLLVQYEATFLYLWGYVTVAIRIKMNLSQNIQSFHNFGSVISVGDMCTQMYIF